MTAFSTANFTVTIDGITYSSTLEFDQTDPEHGTMLLAWLLKVLGKAGYDLTEAFVEEPEQEKPRGKNSRKNRS